MRKGIKTNLMQFLQIVLIAAFVLLSSTVSAQVTIGADTPPKATLDVVGDNAGGAPVGVIAPRVSLSYLNSIASAYTVDQIGVIVYVTEVDGVGVGATSNIDDPGYYYYDGRQWLRFVVPDVVEIPSEPWRVSGTGVEATGNSQNIYQNAQVTMGRNLNSSPAEATAQVEIYSDNKGFLLPRLSKRQRDQIVNPSESLLIWNTDEGCFNFWKVDKWKSMCGGTGDAEIQISALDCAAGKVKGHYQVGNAITGGEYIEITLEVLEPGGYTIEAAPSDKITGNKDNYGFLFQRSGTFSAPGKYTIQIPALGTPLKDGIFDLELMLNGVPFNPGCVKEVEVAPATAKFYFVGPCGQKAADKLKRGDASTGKTIEVKVNVVNPGSFSFSTNTVYGVNYSVTNVSLVAGEQMVILTANGVTPTQADANASFTVSGTGNDPSLGGTGSATCDVIVEIEEGFADVTVDKSSVKVYGTYVINKETASGGNYIELKVTTATPGFWNGTAECAGTGFSFKGEGVLGAGDVGSTPVTLKLFAEGVALVNGPQDFTLRINGGEAITVRVNVAYRHMTIAGFGHGTYQPFSGGSAQSSRAILQSDANFGLTGTVPTLGITITGVSSDSGGRIATFLQSNNPDIIVTGYNYLFNAADHTALASFMSKGGVLIVCSERNDYIRSLMNALFSINSTVGYTGGAGQVYQLINEDIPVLNGPFGDIRGKGWGEDASATATITSGMPTGAKMLTSNNTSMIYKNFLFIGDGGFLSGDRTNTSTTTWPCRNDSQGRPVAKQYSGGTAYNAQLYANIIAWAIDYAQTNKTN